MDFSTRTYDEGCGKLRTSLVAAPPIRPLQRHGPIEFVELFVLLRHQRFEPFLFIIYLFLLCLLPFLFSFSFIISFLFSSHAFILFD